MKITKFKSLDIHSKYCQSPYEDGTFDFITVNIPFKDAHTILIDHFILSRPLDKSLHRIQRQAMYLDEHYYNGHYILLDMDKIYTTTDCNIVINYFKNNNYNINLFTSKSFGTDRYTLKAFIKCSFSATKERIIGAISMLNEHLKGLTEVDEASYRSASYQASIPNVKQLLFREDGIDLRLDQIKDYIPKPITNDVVEGEGLVLNNEVIQWFVDYFVYNHQAKFKQAPNSNNTFQVSLPIEKTKYGYFWSHQYPWILQHPNSQKNISALSDFYKSDLGKAQLKEENKRKLNSYFNDLNVTLLQNHQYFKVREPEKELIQSFLNTPDSVLKIKGVMNSGKSNIISEIIKQRSNRILFITMRRSLSYDIKNKYKNYNIKHYLEHLNSEYSTRYRIGDSLVIQIDSLYKIDPLDFDIVIIDEFESMCLHTQQNMQNSPYYIQNMKTLKTLFEQKQIVIADAFLNNFSSELYFKNKIEFFIKNEYQDTTSVNIYSDKQIMIDKLINCVKQKEYNEIVTASFTTLNEMEVVNNILLSHGYKVAIINSKTTEDVKKLIYELFNEKYHNKYDVILFSPTITVGISIMNNVSHSFHYDEGKSVDTISSIQMTKRSRLAKNVHIYIDGKYSQTSLQTTSSTNTSNYLLLVQNFKENIKKYLKQDSYSLYYNPDTDNLSDIGLFNLKFLAHLNLYTSHHKDVFLFLCHQQYKNVQYITDVAEHSDFTDKLSELKKEINNNYISLLDDFNINNTCLNLADYEELILKQQLSKEDEQLLVLLETKKEFPYMTDKDIYDISKQYCIDSSYISKLKYAVLFLLNDKDQIDKHLSNIVLSNIKPHFCLIKDYIGICKYMIFLKHKGVKLKNIYSKIMIEEHNILYNNQDKEIKLNFEKFLYKIGYICINGVYKFPPHTYKYINEIIKNKTVKDKQDRQDNK